MLTSISGMGGSVSATQLLIHDYERSSYHVVEEFADVIETRGRLALFQMKGDANVTALEEMARQYELDPS